MMTNYCFVTIAIEGKFQFDLNGILFPKLLWEKKQNWQNVWDHYVELFIQSGKGQNNFWNRMLFKVVPWDFSDLIRLEQYKLKFEKMIGVQKPT